MIQNLFVWKKDIFILLLLGSIGFVSGPTAFLFCTLYIFYRLNQIAKLGNSKTQERKENFIEKYNSKIFEDFYALGDTREERTKKINTIFDSREKTISFQWYWQNNEQYLNNRGHWETNKECYKKVELQRNLANMEPKEREFLRTVFLLFNEQKITESNFTYYLLAFINGNGKGSIIDYAYWGYSNTTGVKDGPSTVKYIVDNWDASVDSAINHLLRVINEVDESGKTKTVSQIKSRISGNNAWLNEEEIEETIFKNDGNYQLNLGHIADSDVVLKYSGEGSLITIAPPGSGKTQCFVIPNMLNWKGAALILDIKGEIYAATHKWREKNVGKIYKFSPLDPNNSSNYNPLTFVREEPDYIWEDSRFLADMMIVPSGTSDPFWENMARDVLNAAIAHVTFNNEPDDRPMSKVLDIIYGIGWDEMITSLKTNILVSSMRRMGSALEEMEKKQRDSVLKTAQSSLSSWQGERIAKVTNKSDWNPLDLRNGTPTIYICINPNEIESYLSVIRVFIAQHIRMLTTELPQRGAAPALFMLDELPRLKKMPPVDEALNIGRQYGIKLWMFAQSYGQLKDAYSDPEGLIGSCAVRTFMNLPLNDEYTTKISDQLGHRHDALGNTKEKLVEPIELAGPDYRDYILVMATGTKPAKVKKRFAYEDEEIMAKMN